MRTIKCFKDSVYRHFVEPRSIQVLAEKKLQLRRQTNVQIIVPCVIF